jgi:ABC-type sugar transport system permease subunit
MRKIGYSHFGMLGKPFTDRFAVLQQDLEFFRESLSHIEKQVKELQQVLQDHVDVAHSRRNFILTILAAIYLSLSFTTSFFGMNINTTTPAGPQGFSNWTASWIMNSPVDIQNPTKALVSTIGSSAPQSYPWKTVIITAICLLVTLPLSLTIGGGLRLAYRWTTYYATYARIIAIVPGMTFIFFSILGQKRAGYLMPGFGFYISVFFNSSLLFFLWRKRLGALKRKQRGSVWTSMLIVTLICFALDFFIPYVPIMVVP